MTLAARVQILRMFARLVGRVPVGHLWYLWRRMRNEKPHRFAGQTRINTFFPPHPSPAFDRFCASVVARARVPFSTYLAVTGRCPFRCPHCSYAGRTGTEMTTDQMLDVIGQIKGIGTCTLGLTGGEAMLRGDLADLVAAAGPEMASIVFTTGRGLDEGRASDLARAGVTCVTVGIESADAVEHDEVRGAVGSFDEARAAVAACRAAGVYTAVSTVGTHERLRDGQLDRMYDLAQEWGVGEFRLLAPVATGGLTGCAAAMLSDEEMRALAEFHVAHNRRRGGPAVASFAYLESADMFGCGAGYHHLFVDAAGEVCPCDLTPLSFGNVRDEPLADIWTRMGEHFSRPRCGCLMGELVGEIPPDAPQPLPPEQSAAICPRCARGAPLPEAYKRLL